MSFGWREQECLQQWPLLLCCCNSQIKYSVEKCSIFKTKVISFAVAGLFCISIYIYFNMLKEIVNQEWQSSVATVFCLCKIIKEEPLVFLTFSITSHVMLLGVVKAIINLQKKWWNKSIRLKAYLVSYELSRVFQCFHLISLPVKCKEDALEGMKD